jgi:hypothetical protein
MASTYRRKKGSETWHFCANCSNWPAGDYEEQVTAPSTGELCNECRAKRLERNCR